MAISADDLLRRALELDEPERVRLVTELLATIEPETAANSRSDAEWIAEIEQRARTALAGGPTVSWDEARRGIEERFERE